MMREDNVVVLEATLSRADTSLRIRLVLLRCGDRWHVACRRRFTTDEGEDDFGGADTYVTEMSETNMHEADARDMFRRALTALVAAPLAWKDLS